MTRMSGNLLGRSQLRRICRWLRLKSLSAFSSCGWPSSAASASLGRAPMSLSCYRCAHDLAKQFACAAMRTTIRQQANSRSCSDLCISDTQEPQKDEISPLQGVTFMSGVISLCVSALLTVALGLGLSSLPKLLLVRIHHPLPELLHAALTLKSLHHLYGGQHFEHA